MPVQNRNAALDSSAAFFLSHFSDHISNTCVIALRFDYAKIVNAEPREIFGCAETFSL
jgi:hypothetical protein